MKKTIGIGFLILFLFPLPGKGQYFSQNAGKKIDSLEKILSTTGGKPKADALLALSKLYWRINPVKSINYGKQAVLMYRDIMPEKVPDALFNTAIAFHYYGQTDSTVYYTRKILDEYDKYLSPRHKGNIYNLLCVAYKNQGEYIRALEAGKQAKEYFTQQRDSVKTAWILDNMSGIYKELGDYQEALNHSLESLRIFEKKRDTVDMAGTHFNIANIYASLKDYAQTEYHLNRAVALFKSGNDAYGLADIYNNFGVLYSDRQLYDSAYVKLQKALEIYKRLGVQSGIATAMQNIGLVQKFTGEYPRALRNLTRAAAIFDTLDLQDEKADAYMDLSDVYIQTGKYKKAEKYLLQSGEILNQNRNARLRIKLYKLLRELYSKSGDMSGAYRYERKRSALKDSVETVEVKKQIAGLEYKYENEKKQKEIEHLRDEKRIQEVKNRNLMLLSIGLMAFMAFSSVFVFYRRKKEKTIESLQREKLRLKKQQIEQELNHFKKQMTTYALNIMHRNILLKDYLNMFTGIREKDMEEVHNKIHTLKNKIRHTLKSEKEWKDIERFFVKSDPEFIKKFKSLGTSLTQRDLRLSSLVRLGLSNKEIANILNVNVQSVKNSLVRLNKKIGNTHQKSIRKFIQEL